MARGWQKAKGFSPMETRKGRQELATKRHRRLKMESGKKSRIWTLVRVIQPCSGRFDLFASWFARRALWREGVVVKAVEDPPSPGFHLHVISADELADKQTAVQDLAESWRASCVLVMTGLRWSWWFVGQVAQRAGLVARSTHAEVGTR